MDFSDLLEEIVVEIRAQKDRGTVADYIPELSHADPNLFGISVYLANGEQYSAGDAQTLFRFRAFPRYSPWQ